MSKRVLTLDEIMQAVAPVLRSYNITEAKVFGSYAKGCATPYSDVDIYVDSKLRGLSFFGLLEDIVCTLPIPVDLVDKYTLIPGGELHTEIMKTGIDISMPDVHDVKSITGRVKYETGCVSNETNEPG